ncbi:hypothetical protein DRW41_00780 [Neobacillus piezotolerans]|uniref:Uncharacterized protein n=1 Tax=Neobacillus piezotolerans TaxID=2259171 RepID=A0A3D8GUL1_9BACI|nr:hypothetical protein [Neobacillus piezotolerans]RDU38138.1 hypothetical protein DRW41_00780 [Neobacillus piezotolerans]
MEEKELLLKLNAEQLLMRVIRYNNLVYLQAPEMVRASELRMILESLCKAVASTKAYPGESHKDFIKGPLVEKWAKDNEDFFRGADEESLELLQYHVNRNLSGRAEAIFKIMVEEKEEEERERLHKQHGVTDIEDYQFKKIFDEVFSETELFE